MPDNRNFIIAIALSIAVLIGWQFFIAGPEMEKARQQAEIAAQQQTTQTAPVPGASTTTTTTTAPTVPGAAPAVAAPTLTREAAIAQSTRVPIATGALAGSINLTGARIDDLHLLDFHETVDKTSPTIILLSPSGAPDAYFAEFGWSGPAEAGQLPGRETQWTALAGVKLTTASPVTLTYDNGAGLTFSRTIALDDKYMFTVTDTVANKGTATVAVSPYGRVTRTGPWNNPVTGIEDPVQPHVAGYWILHEGMIGVTDKLQEWSYKSIREDGTEAWNDIVSGWVGITDKYWATALVPDQTQPFTGGFAYTDGGVPAYQANFQGASQTIAPGGTGAQTSRLFAGAKQVAVVDGYQSQFGIKLFDRLIDWGWFWYFTKPLFYLMDWFFRVFGNFGVAILAVTVIVKAAFFPLANKSYKSMSAMKKVQPQMTALREQYKDDKVKQQQALMELYKKEKINPLAGCWPIAIQIPVFFSLYKVLFVTIEMRHAPFFGWIHDLSAPDPTHVFNLFGLLPYDPSLIPVIGSFLAIGLWPVIMGVTMFVQMRLNPTPPDPTQALIFTWMPLIFTFMLASFPAGLVIYWAWNNTLSVSQQYFIMRRQGAAPDLWGNILETLGLRKATPVPATTPAITMPKPANDDSGSSTPTNPNKKKNKNKPAKAKG